MTESLEHLSRKLSNSAGSAGRFDRYRTRFPEFCGEFVKVEDADTRNPVPLAFWPCQARAAQLLCKGEWLCVLKTRRIGMTWLLAAYAMWKASLFPRQTVVIVNQHEKYAADFIDRCRFIHSHLPEFMRHRPTRDSACRLEFNREQHGSVIRSVACTPQAIHSLTANLIIFDEAARMEFFKEARHAAQPAVEVNGGQIVVLSTSDGPRGEFYDLCTTAMDNRQLIMDNERQGVCATGRAVSARATPGKTPPLAENRMNPTHEVGGTRNDNSSLGSAFSRAETALPVAHTRYKFLFFDWRHRPGRDAKWYAREKAQNASDPLFMKRQYPCSPEESFESAQGRVYSQFTQHGPNGKLFIRAINPDPYWKHYRGIDFGAVDPFVCLWACVVPGAGPALTIDPACRETIREMLAYSYDAGGNPEDKHNHAPDALRYLVTTAGNSGLTGHVHVYRELYVANAAAQGLSTPELAQKILAMSGTQHYTRTIADRANRDGINMLCRAGINTDGYAHLSGDRGTQIEQGIARVNALVIGTVKGASAVGWPKESYPQMRDLQQRGIF